MPRNQLSKFDKELRSTISANLKKYTSHLTQGQLSAMTGIPASTLSGYFAMRSTPNAGNLQKIVDSLNINKSDIDPRFAEKLNTGNKPSNDSFPELTNKDEHQIAKDLENMINALDGAAAMGEPEDAEDMAMIKASLETAMRLSKRIAKKKFTPKKYRDE
jgi:transcriptional regulator with XRE-family HTH domain